MTDIVFPPGLYALGAFGGAPIDPADARILGLTHNADFAARGDDPHLGAGAVDWYRAGSEQLIFVGRLRDAAGLAAELNCAPHPAAIARAGLACWGEGVRHRLGGEWTIAQWDGAAQRLTIVTSHLLRDDLFLARSGDRFALAPSLDLLPRLAWVEGGLDPQGLALAYAHPVLRFAGDGQTAVRGVRSIIGGTFLTLDRNGVRLLQREAPAIPRFDGTVADAPAAASACLARAMAHAIAPYRRIGILVSGGLDSSIVAAFAARAIGAGQQLVGFTSAAPAGSGLPDESARALEIGAALGFPVRLVRPDPTASPYFPAPHLQAHRGPTRSVRHYLYDALHAAAQTEGVELLLDGELGEASVTQSLAAPGLRARLRGSIRQLGARLTPDTRLTGAVLADLAPDLIATLPADYRRWRWRTEVIVSAGRRGTLGLAPAHPVLGHVGTAAHPFNVRRCSVFHDPALAALVAAMPPEVLRIGGADRGLGRAMLRGMLPDALRLETAKLPFSPDYMLRSMRDAPAARAWLGDRRSGPVGALLDVPVLMARLDRIADATKGGHGEITRTQFGMFAAGYLDAQ